MVKRFFEYSLFNFLSLFTIFKAETWFKRLGFEGSIMSQTDIILIIQVVCALIFLYVTYRIIDDIVRLFKKKNSLKILPHGPNDISVTSHNQTGGITAGVVIDKANIINSGRIQRILDDNIKDGLLNALDKDKEFNIHVRMNDNEALNLAYEIKSFLISNGFKYKGMTAFSMNGGNGSVIMDKEKNTIVIGENINTNSPLIYLGIAVGIE